MARKGFGGVDLTNPVNRIQGKVALAVNVRAYFSGGFTLRSLLTDAILTVSGAIQTISRLNDSTPAGPVGGFTYVIKDILGNVYDGVTGVLAAIAEGLSANPVSIVPFRPNTSVQPWDYIGDVAPTPAGSITYATIHTKYAIDSTDVDFNCSGMLKVRSDGLIYKMGIAEPQFAPTVSTENTVAPFSGDLNAKSYPWTNVSGANPSFAYGQTNGADGVVPFDINVLGASTVTVTSITGTATINGGSKTPTSLGPSTGASTNPGHFVQVGGTGLTPPATATVVIGAFYDSSGLVMPAGVAPLFKSNIIDVGSLIGTAIPIPVGAATFRIGINSTGNTFSANSGSFAMAGNVTTDALPTATSILGELTCAYFGDSPHSGPVANYIWKNPSDSGGGISRTIGNVTNGAGTGTATGNSFIFDATFTSGIPALPGTGSPASAMFWTTLNGDSVAVGGSPVFPASIEPPAQITDGIADFNFCLYGNIFIPAPGNYTFVLTYKDDAIWGIGADATLVSATGTDTGSPHATSLGSQGQTITVINGLPLLPKVQISSGSASTYGTVTAVVNFASAGIKPIEIDFDYWEHSGRILLLEASASPGGSATVIPPTPTAAREGVQYWYVYRSSLTGALSNPSPASPIETIPVLANTISSIYSIDPQVDKVDYYRQDTGLPNPTYVATGPNDNGQGGGVNTAITDSLSDISAAANPILQFDNYEPFPSIDLPKSGTVSVAGGVITQLTGDPFNIRWLPGTLIQIGSPTQLAYAAVRRPSSPTSWDFTGLTNGVPDGTNLVYNIAEPILAAQPLAYLFGPTDNINFMFGVGDPLRPGTLYWCKGSNLDSAPDTNQMDVTDPSEPLVNGAMAGGRGVLASIRRFWVIMPNFFNAEATATGTTGSTWTLQATSITRGLFIPRCLAVSGGGNIFFRVDDGIHISPGGLGSESITDGDLYPLFSHEGSVPSPVSRPGLGGVL